MSPNAEGGGELRGLSQCVQLYTGAQINFGDLTPYFTYEKNLHSQPNKAKVALNTTENGIRLNVFYTKNKKVTLFGTWVFEE
jgi:hypothetical protein